MTAVSVLVPVHDQSAFLGRALASLRDQQLTDWAALVLDDGSHDDPRPAAAAFLDDPRLQLVGWRRNRGLGATLNAGLDAATAPVVAYLPADDVWDADHLAVLLATLEGRPELTWAWSGIRHHDGQVCHDAPPGHPLQLVQVAHRRSTQRWTERAELESDDLGRLFWDRLGAGAATGRVSCEWTDHPAQRHKAIRESYDGGLNVFRSRYQVREPLRFLSSDSGLTDEVARYAGLRPRHPPPAGAGQDGMDVLIVGELAFNAERVLALVDRGHRLHGLWTRHGLGDSTVGPLPFGHVHDLPQGDWRGAVRALAPDVVWAQLNWRAVPLALAVRRSFPDLPFVWHFKESPHRSRVRGEWPMLAELFTTADASLVATEEERAWLLDALPGRLDPARIGVLDGDLPSAEWLTGVPSPRLSEQDGDLHTVVLGRPLGFDADWVSALTDRGVHLHLYGQVDAPGPKGSRLAWWDEAVRRAPDRLHLHATVEPADWVRALSRYDAGWLHRTVSCNGGDLRRATWDDLNSPARLPVLVMAGLPLLLPDNRGHRVAVDRITAAEGTGLPYDSADTVMAVLQDRRRLQDAREAALTARHEHTFDAHVDHLLAVFESIRR